MYPLLALLAMALIWLPAGASMAETFKFGGTGSGLGAIRILADAYGKTHPQFSLTIVPSLGSSGGLKALDAGVIHIAVISRSLKAEETAKGMTAVEYGKTPFVLATTKQNVSGLTLTQIAAIYAGEQRTWPDGTPIRLVLRPAHDGDTGLLAGFSPEIKQAVDLAASREGMVVANTDQDSADNLQRLPGALGTSSLGLILSEGRPLKALAINGVAPSTQAIANGSYAYVKTMYLVTKGAPPSEVVGFLDFVRSVEGRKILTANGHWTGEPSAGAKQAAQ